MKLIRRQLKKKVSLNFYQKYRDFSGLTVQNQKQRVTHLLLGGVSIKIIITCGMKAQTK